MNNASSITKVLIEKGVVIPHPGAVHIGPEIIPGHIAGGVVLHPGCRLDGAHTAIDTGSVLGAEGPVVLSNCQLGKKVHLGSGYFEGSVFLDGVSMGGGAHVRPGCLLEEQASGAHTVGLKHTILFPYVTLGSLINFCDCLMAGGTSRKNHSEVGSSYIHFNFTPHQDKATASLIGDVPRGVLLNQPPVFLGGQGGMVGPVRVEFGTIVPAGQIVRKDILEAGQRVTFSGPEAATAPYEQDVFGRIDRIMRNNLVYLGNLFALHAWYRHLRKPFMENEPIAALCHKGALGVMGRAQEERIKRLGEWAAKMPASIARLNGRADGRVQEALSQQRRLVEEWPKIEAALNAAMDRIPDPPDALVEMAVKGAVLPSGNYLKWVDGLDEATRAAAFHWLDGVVHDNITLW